MRADDLDSVTLDLRSAIIMLGDNWTEYVSVSWRKGRLIRPCSCNVTSQRREGTSLRIHLFPPRHCFLYPLQRNHTIYGIKCEVTFHLVLVQGRCRTPLTSSLLSPFWSDATSTHCFI